MKNNEVTYAIELYDIREALYAAINANDWDAYDIACKKIRDILDR